MTIVNGVAILKNVALTKAGTYTLRVVDGLLSGAVSNSIVIT